MDDALEARDTAIAASGQASGALIRKVQANLLSLVRMASVGLVHRKGFAVLLCSRI